jgi:hypothetical protein
MADYPKNFTKGNQVRHAHNKADEVRLKFAGYRLVESKTDTVAPATAVSEDSAVPELTPAEMSKVADVENFDVVDTTNEDSAAYPESPYKRKKN